MDFELYINWGVVGIIILIALVIALLAANIKVVPQAHAFVIERLGAYHATWSTGLHLKIPFIDRIAKKVSLKEQVIDFPPQPVITKDNVTMQIDTVVYFQITDSKLYAYGVERPISAIENLSATTLRNIIGEMELDHTLTSRDVINSKIRVILDEATANVDTRTELRIQKAMRTLMADKTCFVIAHRLSTIRNADMILVVRDGEIVERGTHESLMQGDTFYRHLYNAQFA